MSYAYIKENMDDVERNIIEVCRRIGRNREDITLIGVTKTYEADIINASIEFGITDIGENRVQEIQRKFEYVTPGVKWHLIGHLQTNKVKFIIDKVDLIHSVDSLHLAEEIDRRAAKADRVMDILLQVNIAEESTKFGTSKEEIFKLVEGVSALKHVRVKGLMNIAPFDENPEKVRPYFRQMKEIFDEISKMPYDSIEMVHLSMGMSNDYRIAIEEGATMIRVGSSIYGARQYTK